MSFLTLIFINFLSVGFNASIIILSINDSSLIGCTYVHFFITTIASFSGCNSQMLFTLFISIGLISRFNWP